jgi:hypothetical protein
MIARLTQPPRLTSSGPLYRRIDGPAGIKRYRSGIGGERASAATARDRRDHRKRRHAARACPEAHHRHDHDARPAARCQPAAPFPSTSHSSGRLSRVSSAWSTAATGRAEVLRASRSLA